MSTFTCFEEIEAWQKSRDLVMEIYRITKENQFSRDYPLRDQIRKAAISVISNIAEGFERGGTKEFIQFLSISKGSLGEMKSQLYIALDQSYIRKDEYDKIVSVLTETSKLVGGLMKYLKHSRMVGPKYHG